MVKKTGGNQRGLLSTNKHTNLGKFLECLKSTNWRNNGVLKMQKSD